MADLICLKKVKLIHLLKKYESCTSAITYTFFLYLTVTNYFFLVSFSSAGNKKEVGDRGCVY